MGSAIFIFTVCLIGNIYILLIRLIIEGQSLINNLNIVEGIKQEADKCD